MISFFERATGPLVTDRLHDPQLDNPVGQKPWAPVRVTLWLSFQLPTILLVFWEVK